MIHFVKYEDIKLLTLDGELPRDIDGYPLEDGAWNYWVDIYGNFEIARFKFDAQDHFWPPPKVIKEENIFAWAESLDDIYELYDSSDLALASRKKVTAIFSEHDASEYNADELVEKLINIINKKENEE